MPDHQSRSSELFAMGGYSPLLPSKWLTCMHLLANLMQLNNNIHYPTHIPSSPNHIKSNTKACNEQA